MTGGSGTTAAARAAGGAWAGRPVTLLCDAATVTGLGHFVRSTALARVLADRGADVRVALPPDSVPRAVESVVAAGWHVDVGPWAAPDVARTAGGPGAVVVVDSYRVDGPWLTSLHRVLGAGGATLAVLDDLADRPFTADLVVNPGLGAEGLPYPAGTRVLAGPEHALLRPEFAAHRASALRSAATLPERPRRVLSLFGGTDAAGMASVGASAAALAFPEAEVRAVVPAAGRSALPADRPRITVLDHVAAIHEEMLLADLVVSAGGTTLWELCCLARPTAVVAVVANQLPAYRELTARGAVLPLADRPVTDPGLLGERLRRLVSGTPLGAVARRAAELTDGQGAERVADALVGAVRHRPATTSTPTTTTTPTAEGTRR
ncbi:PseG/SpsG family protein [Modestobacter sp. SYSU DS0511]